MKGLVGGYKIDLGKAYGFLCRRKASWFVKKRSGIKGNFRGSSAPRL